MPGDGAFQLYKYVKKKTGKSKPTAALFSNETEAGRGSAGQSTSYAGAGFNVMYKEGLLPPPPIGDVTPYVQTLMTSDGGKPPDVTGLSALDRSASTCTSLISAGGYTGTYYSALYDPRLVSCFKGAQPVE